MGDVGGELGAMRKIVAALDGLDEVERDRVLRWLAERYGPKPTPVDEVMRQVSLRAPGETE